MSDTQVETSDAVVDGAVESDSIPETPAESVERQYLPVEDFSDYYVKLKVQGEELDLPLHEALEGAMRQQDYTRKTQEVAAERERLTRAEAVWTALEQDPTGTLQALQDAFGLNAVEQGDDEPIDEYEARLRRIEEQERFREEQAQVAQVEREISGLQERYGEFDQDELIAYAIEKRIPDLEAAYLHRRERQRAVEEAETAKQRRREEALAAKRQAQVVEGGAHRQGVSRQLPSKPSLREAYFAAKEKLGS